MISGSFKLDNHEIPINQANGYIDYFYSNMILLKPLVRNLFWGRINHDFINIVYSYTTKVDGEIIGKLIVNFKNTFIEFSTFDLNILSYRKSEYLNMNYPHEYEIIASNNDINIKFIIKIDRTTMESFFIKDMGFKEGWKVKLLTYLTKNPKTMKYISQADIELQYRNENFTFSNIFFINEYVEFEL